jgi:hypothetical protein
LPASVGIRILSIICIFALSFWFGLSPPILLSLNRRIEADRKAKADPEAANRRATDAQVIEDVEQLITV